MKFICKKNKEQRDYTIIDMYNCESLKSDIVYFLNFIAGIELDTQIQYLLNNIHVNINFGLIIKNKSELTFILNHSIFEKINFFLIDQNLLDNKDIHFLFLIGKNICINNVNKKITNEDLNNPIISHILCDSSNNKILNKSEEILNKTFHFNVNKYCHYEKNYNYKDLILNNIRKVWGHFSRYYIFNLNKELTNAEIEDIYNVLSSHLGKIIQARPVNDDSKKISYTRDVKFVPNSNHFYSSNLMQPLHSDFAYFPYDKSPDYLTLFCYKKAEYGGITSLITTKKVKEVMKKYNPELYSKVIDLDFTWKSQVDSQGNFEIHDKFFFDENTNYINWNYFQIKKEYNNESKMKLREEIFYFFNEVISKGYMYDLNIEWERGDCVLFNDHLNLHTRTTFLGERWLSGNAFFIK